MPQRIRRKRTGGWMMPRDAVYVGRPTIFGNPFDLETFGRKLSLELFAETARGRWNPELLKSSPDEMAQAAYHAHFTWMERIGNHPLETICSMLRGKDLVCWCKVQEACHGDILIEIANA